jgi:hypothetical protein
VTFSFISKGKFSRMARGAPKGHPKWGGRQKGSVNKSTQALFDLCAKKKIDVFEAMLDLAITELDRDKKFDKLSQIAHYLYPKRKAVEHSLEDDSGVAEKLKAARERLNKLAK